VAKPARLNVTVYVPGCRFSMRYRPAPSVVAVRTFSMSAGLAASTVAPGSTAPELSLTTPASVACAQALAGINNRVITARALSNARIPSPLNWYITGNHVLLARAGSHATELESKHNFGAP